MARQPRIVGEIEGLRGLLARLSLETKLLRLEQALRRKDWSDQPRAPAGQSDGGQWVSGGGSGTSRSPLGADPSAQSDQTQERTVAEDNGYVMALTARVTARVKASGLYKSQQALGTQIYLEIADEVRKLQDQNFVDELFIPANVAVGRPQSLGSVRLDLLSRRFRDLYVYTTIRLVHEAWTQRARWIWL